MEKIGAIVQARLASTRLPGKVVKLFPNGKTVIEHIVVNLQKIELLEKVIVAIPEGEKGTELETAIRRTGATLFFGSTEDVLSRYYHAAGTHDLDIILRVTADDPLRDRDVERAAIEALASDVSLDYVRTEGLPEGINTEVFRMRSLEKAYREANLWSEREHVTPYIWKNPGKFHCRTISYCCDNADSYRLTLDSIEDWAMFTALFKLLEQQPVAGYAELIALLAAHPEICTINNMLDAGSGYAKSVAQDYIIPNEERQEKDDGFTRQN